ncbi:MAG: SH3 domain-containing protein [Spirochaetes bacterium]|nr:SH3 domain-containing protein [Spirochaetota bacterium]
MKSIRKIVIMLAASIFCASFLTCSNNEGEISPDSYGIVLRGFTAMRIDPMIFAGIVAQLEKGTSVDILDKSETKTWVGKTSGYWYRVRTKEGITGWIFDQNISIHHSKKDSKDRVISEFMAGELVQIRQYLAGKWWSINEFGDFTNHCLELYESEKYRSYVKGNEARPIVGTYRLDFNKNEILFSNGTSFNSNLELAKRGSDYIIKKTMKDYELRFSKISVETSPEPELTDNDKKNPVDAGNGNEAQ